MRATGQLKGESAQKTAAAPQTANFDEVEKVPIAPLASGFAQQVSAVQVPVHSTVSAAATLGSSQSVV